MSDVLERSALQAGKVFIREGEDNIRAYVVQDGEIAAYKKHNGQKVEIARFGPGTIIGELNLMIDDPSQLSYEATTLSTVVSITRQDFQKRLARADKSITTIMEHAVNKIKYYENIETIKALKASEIDDIAGQLIKQLVTGLPIDKKVQFEDAILPHLNAMIKAIKETKEKTKLKSKSNEDD